MEKNYGVVKVIGSAMLFCAGHRNSARTASHADRAGKSCNEKAELRFSLPLCAVVAISAFRLQRYSGVMPAAFTTCAHFTVSALMNAKNSAGVLATTSAPSPAKRSFASGERRIAAASLYSRLTIS